MSSVASRRFSSVCELMQFQRFWKPCVGMLSFKCPSAPKTCSCHLQLCQSEATQFLFPCDPFPCPAVPALDYESQIKFGHIRILHVELHELTTFAIEFLFKVEVLWVVSEAGAGLALEIEKGLQLSVPDRRSHPYHGLSSAGANGAFKNNFRCTFLRCVRGSDDFETLNSISLNLNLAGTMKSPTSTGGWPVG